MGRRMLALAIVVVVVPVVLPLVSRSDAAAARAHRLAGIDSWGYQLQGLEEEGAIDALVESPYELLVLEPTRTEQGSEAFDSAGMVEALHENDKLVLAYVNLGQAEDWRTYWGDDWEAPTEEERGEPDFLVTLDPDGWSGNYPVAYWNERWSELMLNDPGSPLQLVLDDGFDGVYLDWIEAYDDPAVRAAADEEGVEPEQAMVELIGELRATARQRDPDFLVVPQNAGALGVERPEYFDVIDGLAIEDLSFSGGSDTEWGDPASGDIPQDADYQGELLELIELYGDQGLPVFCVDYALESENVDTARATAREAGCVPFVSQTPLDRLPEIVASG